MAWRLAVLLVAVASAIRSSGTTWRPATRTRPSPRPGLNAAFAWARDVSDARIATTSTRQYPLFGTDLSNHVQYLGTEQPHGGFEAAANCRQYLHLLNEGDYDYVIATRDRLEPGKPPYPPTAKWTEAAGGKVILKKPPTVVFELTERPPSLGV